jgi:dihydrofolate reductase
MRLAKAGSQRAEPKAGERMRRVRYRVAASLDGYIAGPSGEVDWIVSDPAVNWSEVYAGVDTVLLGQRTYELTRKPGAPPWPAGWRVCVFSRTLAAGDRDGITFVAGDAAATVAELRAEDGRDIWLFGGGALAGSLLAARLVDVVDVTIVPVLLGAGLPLATGAPQTSLSLTDSRVYPSGIVTLRYEVRHPGNDDA